MLSVVWINESETLKVEISNIGQQSKMIKIFIINHK